MASFPSSLNISIGQSSVAGRKEDNQDCIGVQIPDPEALLLKGVAIAIADGVSAASYGKEAAEMCVQGFLLDYYSTPDPWPVKQSGGKVINALNRWLYGQSQSRGFASEKGYVSTLTTLVLHSRCGYLFHIGDSRIYRIRCGEIELLTRDHVSPVASGVSYLSRAMGLNLSPKVDYSEIELEQGDVFLCTTDGVHEFVSESWMLECYDAEDLEASAQKMTAKAFSEGSYDNLTALMVRVDQFPKASHDEMHQFLLERPFPPILYPGQVIDGLEVEKVLFESPRCQLYRVVDRQSGNVYAMKTPSTNFIDDPAYIERFINEEWIGKRVKHRNLIKVIDRPQKPRFLYYLMEEIDGVSLADYVKQAGGSLSPSELLPLLKQIVAGLRALHRKDTLHQDIKPDNILVTKEGDIMVIDYGSCRVASLAEREVSFERQQALGTVEYGAPEYRLAGAKASVRSDQFSVAMLAYRILTQGKSPYGEKWKKARTEADYFALSYESAFKHSPMVPHWFDGALRKALSIRPESRYDSMSEWLADLETPNPKFVDKRHLSLLEKDPLRFWKGLCLVLVMLVVTLLVILLNRS